MSLAVARERRKKACGVPGYPTNYRLDGDGSIVGRAPGLNEAELRQVLAWMGMR